jgi:hypothetical protein
MYLMEQLIQNFIRNVQTQQARDKTKNSTTTQTPVLGPLINLLKLQALLFLAGLAIYVIVGHCSREKGEKDV